MAANCTLHSAKRTLRRALKARIKEMTIEEKAVESDRVCRLIISSSLYSSSQRISLYLHMESEVNTEMIIKDIFKSGKECFIPRYIGDTMNMLKLRDMEDLGTLPLTSWNIKQPSENEKREDVLTSGGLDLMVVPGLGFTQDGYRIGRGKGYYDSYLHKHEQLYPGKLRTIGIGFSTQLCDNIPCTDLDVKLNEIIFG